MTTTIVLGILAVICLVDLVLALSGAYSSSSSSSFLCPSPKPNTSLFRIVLDVVDIFMLGLTVAQFFK